MKTNHQPLTVEAVFTAFGGVTKLSEALERKLGTVSAWKSRGSIPSDYWNDLVRLARERGLDFITHEALASIGRSERAA